MSLTQYNVRLPDGTTMQIQKLIELTGMTQTQLMIVAIDRMFQQERTKMNTVAKKYLFRYEEIDPEDLGTIGHDPDIQKDFPGDAPVGLRIIIRDAESERESAERAEAVYFRKAGRLGIVWCGDPTFADVDDIESGIDMFLNSPKEWERRN